MIVVLSYSVVLSHSATENWKRIWYLEVGCCFNKTLKHVALGLGNRQKPEGLEEHVGKARKPFKRLVVKSGTTGRKLVLEVGRKVILLG